MDDGLDVEYQYQVLVFVELYGGGLTEELAFNFKTNEEAKEFMKLSIGLPHIESIEGPEVLETCFNRESEYAYRELKRQLKYMELEELFIEVDDPYEPSIEYKKPRGD